MKKIFTFATLLILAQGMLLAQEGKTVSESSVTPRYVQDFQRQQKNVKDVSWQKIDSTTFEAIFTNADGELQGMRFSPKGTEDRYYIDPQYTPQFMKDTIDHMFNGYTIKQVYVKIAKRKSTYHARICKRSGFLFWKKDKDPKVLNFETATGKYIDYTNE